MNEKRQSVRDRVRASAAKHQRQGGLDSLSLPEGVELYKPEKGSVEFDVIPYRISVDTHPEAKKGEVWYSRKYLAHRNVGPEEKFVVCPRTVGKRCPICEEYHKLNKDPDADEEVVQSLRAKERELFNVVLKDGSGEVRVLDISVHLFGLELEREILEGDEANAGFFELKDGRTLKVRWDQRAMGKQKFVEAGRIDFLEREDFGQDVLDAAVDLDAALKILSYEEISQILNAGEPEAEPEQESAEPEAEEEEQSAVRRIARQIGKSAARQKVSDEQQDELPMSFPKKAKKEEKEEDLPSEQEEQEPAGDDVCVACDGSGKTSKGKKCPICAGTGKNEPEAEPEQEGEEAPEESKESTPARRVVRR